MGHGATGVDRVLLTFDVEHPSRPHRREDGLGEILRVLERHEVQATFFLQGRWAAANPARAAEIVSQGHVIGSHSNAHVAMTRLTEDGVAAEVAEAQDRIVQATGVDPRPYLRCPYGDGHDDVSIQAVAGRLGYRLVGWDVDPQDWNHDHVESDVVALVDAGLSRPSTGRPIVLLHSWPATTPGAVDEIIERATDRGWGWDGLDRGSDV